MSWVGWCHRDMLYAPLQGILRRMSVSCQPRAYWRVLVSPTWAHAHLCATGDGAPNAQWASKPRTNVNPTPGSRRLTLRGRARSIALALLVCTGAGLVTWAGLSRPPVGAAQTGVAPDRGSGSIFYPTPAQWASLTVEPVRQIVFRPVYVTEGKIAVNEDQATP